MQAIDNVKMTGRKNSFLEVTAQGSAVKTNVMKGHSNEGMWHLRSFETTIFHKNKMQFSVAYIEFLPHHKTISDKVHLSSQSGTFLKTLFKQTETNTLVLHNTLEINQIRAQAKQQIISYILI